MMNFTEWDNKDEPQGLEGVKRRILNEAPYREFGDGAGRRPQRPQPKPKAQQPESTPKSDEFGGFAGMDPSRLDALKGLASKELNPQARSKFIQNALANFQKQQAKPKSDDAPLAARATRAVTGKEPKKPGALDLGKGGSNKKPPTKPPVASTPEPEDDGTSGKLDDVLKDIQGKDKVGGRGRKVRDKLRAKLEEILPGMNTSRGQGKKFNELLTRLNDKRGDFLEEFIEEYADTYNPTKLKEFNENNNFNTPEGAIDFMKNYLGMEDSPRGLRFASQSPAKLAAMGLAPQKGMYPYDGIQWHDMMASKDNDYSHMEGVRGGTHGDVDYNGVRKFHQKFLKNNVGTGLSREVYNALSPSVRNMLNGLGAPKGNQTGVFDPKDDWEMNFNMDSEGNFLGDSDLDLLSLDEETKEQWGDMVDNTHNNGREARGIMMLQKMMSTGFRDELTGQPVMGGIRGFTADHLMGRLTGGGAPKLDNPFNLAMVGKNINKMKSGRSEEHGNDSFNKLLNGGFTGKRPFDDLFDEDTEDFEDVTDSNKFASWVLERLGGSQFSDKLSERLSTDDGLADGAPKSMEFIENLEDLLNLSSDDIKEYVSRSGDHPNVHMNLRNLTKTVPRAPVDGDQNPNNNSWSGSGGYTYKTKNLDGFRKSMIARIMTDPDLQSDISAIRNGNLNEDKQNKAIAKLKKDFAQKNLMIPQQGISSVFGLGRISTQELIDNFTKKGTDNLSGIKESHPEIYEKLMSELTEGLEKWNKEDITPYMKGADRPALYDKNDKRVLDMLGTDERGGQFMRSAAARAYLSPEEIEAFYNNLSNNPKLPKVKNEFLGPDGNQRLGPFGENWLQPNTDLL